MIGQHVAIMEAKIAIAKFFKKFRIETVPNQDVHYRISATLQMKNGYRVWLHDV